MSTVEILTHKEQALVAIAASIASGSLACIMRHRRAVRDAGVSEAEVLKAIGIALEVRGNTTEVMAKAAQGNLNHEYPIKQPRIIKGTIENLVAIGAAVACNSVPGVEYYLNKARSDGASTRQIQTTIGIARTIKKEATEKADFRIASLIEQVQGKAENAEKQKGRSTAMWL